MLKFENISVNNNLTIEDIDSSIMDKISISLFNDNIGLSIEIYLRYFTIDFIIASITNEDIIKSGTIEFESKVEMQNWLDNFKIG